MVPHGVLPEETTEGAENLRLFSEGWGGRCVRERFVEEILLHFFSLVPYVYSTLL